MVFQDIHVFLRLKPYFPPKFSPESRRFRPEPLPAFAARGAAAPRRALGGRPGGGGAGTPGERHDAAGAVDGVAGWEGPENDGAKTAKTVFFLTVMVMKSFMPFFC